MKIVISAGGTGGHIYPALAIINKLKQRNKDIDILYIGTTDRMEAKIIPSKGIKYKGIDIIGLNRKNILKNIKVFSCYIKALKKCKKILKEYKPDVVIGVGGYVTLPVLYAAHKLKIKTIIHEQNSIPGLSNKLTANFVDKILISLPGSENYFDKTKTIYTGNPRSEEIQEVKKADKEKLGLSKNKKLVVIVMGSLGSMTINQAMKDILLEFSNKEYEVLYITGDKYYEEFKKLKLSSNVKIYSKREDLIEIMKVADLIISRAGATIISEITAIGLPAILIPSPYVTNNHQYKNALELKEKKACVLLEEKDLSKENLLKNIDNLLNNKDKMILMKSNSLKLSKNKSATDICQVIESLIEER